MKIICFNEEFNGNIDPKIKADFFARCGVDFFPYYLAQDQTRKQPEIYRIMDRLDVELPPLEGIVTAYSHKYRIKFLNHYRGDEFTGDILVTDCVNIDLDKFRVDPVEILRLENDPNYLPARVVEIPDDVDWMIEERWVGYDSTYEVVCEKHRKWGVLPEDNLTH